MKAIFLVVTMMTFVIAATIVLWDRRRRTRILQSQLAIDEKTSASFEENFPSHDVPSTMSPLQDEQNLLAEGNNSRVQDASTTSLISLSILSQPKQPFAGMALLHALLSHNLRFGKMDIFHYFELDRPLFSLASATKPGTFNMDDMATYQTPGVTLFMTLNDDPHIEAIFDKMLQVAQGLAKELNGYLLDEAHEPLNDTAIHAMRTKLRQYARTQPVQRTVDDTAQ